MFTAPNYWEPQGRATFGITALKRLVFNGDLAGNAKPSEVMARWCTVGGSAFSLVLLGLALLRRRTR